VLAQGPPGVLGPEHPALAQQRDHVLGEGLEAGRQDRRHHVEPVGSARLGPFHDRVRHLLRRPGEGPVPPAAAESADELAHGEVVPPGQLGEQLEPALRAFDQRPGVHLLGQPAVQFQPLRRYLEHLGQLGQAVLGDDQLLEFGLQCPGLGLGRADGWHQAGQDLDLVRVAAETADAGLQVGVELLRVA
jgi:hypothetical protein